MVNPDTYPVLSGQTDGRYIGGESVQHTLLAKAFRDLGHDVSVVVRDYGQPQGELIEGITVLKTCRREDGVPGIRFIYPRLTRLWAALKRANADVYYQSCADVLTGVTALFCSLHNRLFVYRVAHDTDLMPGKELIRFWRDRAIYRYGLKNADIVAVQSDVQAKLLEEHYGRCGSVISMAVELAAERAVTKDIDVLWVNNFRRFKRPEIALELARSLPQYRFVMVGGPVPGQDEYFRALDEAASDIANLELTGPVPYSRVNEFFERARIFINTSESEGFPNSYLQAWIRGVPVVAFFDPDGLIKSIGLGAACEAFSDMRSEILRLLADQAARFECGERAKTYTQQNYAPSVVAATYEKLFNGLVCERETTPP